MTRVSTYQQSQTLINHMLKSQVHVAEAQRQVDTGKIADTYQGLYQETTTLSGAKSLMSLLEQHKENAAVIQTNLQSYDQMLGSLENASTDLKEAVMGAVNSSSALGLEATVEGVFESVVGVLNSKDTEGYLFAGSKKDVAPVNIASWADLTTALEPPTDIFTNDNLKRTVRVDENRSLETGILADDLGLEIMTALQRIALWQNGTIPTTAPVPTGPAGPVTTPLRQEDQAFLIGEIQNLENLVRDFNEARGVNGLNLKTVKDTQESLDPSD